MLGIIGSLSARHEVGYSSIMANVIPRFIDLISAYDGIGMTSDKLRYLDLIAAGESPDAQEMMCRGSGCALVVRGFWRLFGVNDRRLRAPYVPGKAVTWVVRIAKERGAWVDAHPDKLPGIGDMVLVGGNPWQDGGVEHVYITIELTPDPLTVYSMDGGQVDEERKQIICRRERNWIVRKGALWDVVISGTDPGATNQSGRRVRGWVDLERLAGKDAALG
jgi:hypothetical protein